jgi:hypothetical protein
MALAVMTGLRFVDASVTQDVSSINELFSVCSWGGWLL